MQLSKKTVEILKSFSAINAHLTINPGNKITTVSPTKDILAEAIIDEKFTKQFRVFNLNEFLNVFSSFDNPDLICEDQHCTIKENNQKAKYMFASPDMLTKLPEKDIQLPSVEVEFTLTGEQLVRIQKMAAIMAVSDLFIIGDGKKIVASVSDSAITGGNYFELDFSIPTTETFNVKMKLDKMKLLPGEHQVQISNKRISKFTHKTYGVSTFIAVDAYT